MLEIVLATESTSSYAVAASVSSKVPASFAASKVSRVLIELYFSVEVMNYSYGGCLFACPNCLVVVGQGLDLARWMK